MSYSETDGVTDFSDESKRDEFISKISEMLENSVIRGYRRKDNRIIFDINRKQNDTYYDSDIQISEIDIFYFRRFDTGMMRTGLNNINRLDLKPEEEIQVVDHKKLVQIALEKAWGEAGDGDDFSLEDQKELMKHITYEGEKIVPIEGSPLRLDLRGCAQPDR